MIPLYKSEDWLELGALDRAQLLLVIQGLKRGTIIGGNWTSFLTILKKTHMEYRLNTEKYRLHPVMVVAKPEVLQQAMHEYVCIPPLASSKEYHKVTGWLLNYPACCIDEYLKPRTPQQMSVKKQQRHLSYNFGYELEMQIKLTGTYPDVFDYRPPSFTPCGLHCENALALLTEWKQAIQTLDPIAGEELVYFNRRGMPERLAHTHYLQRESNKRLLEHSLHRLR